MASGDRIELLTADTFNSAMSTVAQQSTVEECSAKITDVDTDVSNLAATVGNINNVASADYQLDTNIYNILVDLYNNRVGTTGDGGGAVGGGTMMGKLNALLSSVGSISNQSLYSTVFVPSSNVLKVILNSAVTLTGRYWAGCFIAKHTGCIMMQVTGYSCNEGYKGGIHIYPGSTLRHETSVAIYPSMPPIYDNTATGDEYPMTFTSINTPQTYTLYMQVQAGEIYYFCPRAFSATYPSVCTNITLYGSTISYF